MSKRSRSSLTSACLLVACTGTLRCAVQRDVRTPATAPCVSDPQLPSFEVASIRPVALEDRGVTSVGEYGLPHFELRGVSLSFLLAFTFEVQPANFIDAPKNLENTVFDVWVESAAGLPLTYEALKPRMQQMLEQRFCLKAHPGSKQVPGYALVVAKGRGQDQARQCARWAWFRLHHAARGERN